MRIVGRHHRVHRAAHAEVQLDLDLRLPHAGGRARPPMQELGVHASPTASSTCAPRSAAGLDVDEFAGRLSFFFAIGMNFFMEVAKLRAARLLWHRVMTQFEPKKPAVADAAHALPDVGRVAHRAGPVQQHRAHRRRGAGRGARRHAEPAHQLRSTRRSRCRPTSSARIARNTQLILAEETGVTHVVDPLGGIVLRRGAHADARRTRRGR